MRQRFSAARWAAALTAPVTAAGVMMVASASSATIVLPNDWTIASPPGAWIQTGTMPQGMAASPDGTTIAVVESGYNPPTLGLYHVPDLIHVVSIPLPGAFGRPVWLDADHVLVAGANADALLDVDVRARTVGRTPFPKGSYPLFVAASRSGSTVAVATDGDSAVRIGSLTTVGQAHAIAIGERPGGIAFDETGTSVFATSRAASELLKVDATGVVQHRRTGLHPGAVAVAGSKVYVAQSDADTVGIYDAGDLHALTDVAVGDAADGIREVGASPNDVTVTPSGVFATLGAANSIAVLRDDRLAGRMPAGWYPTDALVLGNTVYVLDGKGEGARPNPAYRRENDDAYIGAIELGSLRAYSLSGATMGGSPPGAREWSADPPSSAVVRKNGPISHVFFVLKENRTYDQVLGDVSTGNGDAALARFGADVTPNEHAIARRFGLFDNSYTSGEVSAPGHMWTDAAFANDYVERLWPPLYGERYTIDDLSTGSNSTVPANGYLWDAARRAHVTFLDYGELSGADKAHPGRWVAVAPSLQGAIDPLYAGWDLDISDLTRVREWRRDFTDRLTKGTLPQFEFIWLPGDHTYGTKPGALAPASYVAINDAALGQMVETLSRSRVWKSSAMFVIEDDAQDGPDHVSDQRTTMFLISPYARGGVRHEHYSTLSVLRTIEIVLGMQPLSAYDATAIPMDAAFIATPNASPYVALAPKIDVTRRNAKVAYGASLSARIDFSHPDAAPPGVLERILAHDSVENR